jgi:excisionase family DNA binding protein
MDRPRLLKASDVAKYLNISISLAYRLMQKGEIPVIRIHKSVRVREADLEEFIFQQRSSN